MSESKQPASSEPQNDVSPINTSAEHTPRSFDPSSLPPTERGHRGGIVGMESAAKGMQGGLAEELQSKGGDSFFGMIGGPLKLGGGDRLSKSREEAKKLEVEEADNA